MRRIPNDVLRDFPRARLAAVLMVSSAAALMAASTGHANATSVASDSARRSSANVCAASLRGFEEGWGGTGEWRRLAPYPVPREASPTSEIGVWLERWTLESGAVELRRVSAHETRTARVAGSECVIELAAHRRQYDSTVMATSFTDAALRDVVRANARGMIYVWSPGMPLSIQGFAEARAAAASLGIAFTAVVADARPGELDSLRVVSRVAARIAPSDSRAMESVELVYRNATVHYPAVVLYKDGAILDAVIPGYKGRDTYRKLASGMFDAPEEWGARAAQVTTSADVPKMWVDHRARITNRSSIPTPRDIGFFFKPVSGTNLITYTANDRAYLFDITNGKEMRIPGHVDPVPTPDGRFLTRPGLIVHPMPALIRGDTASIFIDPELPDEYQTVSILRESRGDIRYRVVTGWHDNARFRDYDVKLVSGASGAVIRPAGPAFVPCTGRVLSLPINAKSGREFGAFDVRRGTNGIMEVQDDGSCVDRLDLGFASGKLSFSYDGKLVAFSTAMINVDTAGTLLKPSETFYKDALILQRASGRLVSLSRNRPLRAQSFPEFLPNGSIMLLDQRSPMRPEGLLRVIEITK
jgi:hypothetical protein